MAAFPGTGRCIVDIDLPTHAEIDAELGALRLGVDASELHGALCGLACGGGNPGRETWLRQSLATADAPAPAAGSALDRVYLASLAQLEDASFGFELLLPAGEQAVGERADALLAWCRGFLGGFGLSGAGRANLSEEAAEALEDLGRIAASQLSYEDPTADEDALQEVTEFVRVAALLLHGDCVMAVRHRRSMH